MSFETRKERYSRPDPEMKREPMDPKGRYWSRTLARRCPWCDDVFYGYQAEGEERQPFQVERERPLIPIIGYKDLRQPDGSRETCGHDLCLKAEESWYLARHQGYQRACDGSSSPATTPTPAVAKGGLRRAAL